MPDIKSHHGLLQHAKLHAEDSGGSGRPVVLIHGWPLYGASWSEQIPALTDAGHRVITYDRRGFGRSDKPSKGYDYDVLAEDLASVIEELDVSDVTLVGFSMGGGEVARYLSKYGTGRVHSVVFAAAVTPYLMKGPDNPDGPLDGETAQSFADGLEADPSSFYDEFITGFFSADGELKVSESQRAEARAMCDQADKTAALSCMQAWGTTDFRDDLATITVPTLVIHGDSDATVPLEGSGQRTHAAIAGSELHVITGAPHGCNVSHAEEFNRELIAFLAK